MKLPHDVDATVLIEALARLGYQPVRQTASHIRLCCNEPASAQDRNLGGDSRRRRGMSKDELLDALFG